MKRLLIEQLKMAAVALVVIVLSLVVYDAAHRAWRDGVPVEVWMPVSDMTVPDHAAGDDPIVAFHRVVTRDLRVEWTMEIHDAETGQQVCGGAGRSVYSPEEPSRIAVPMRTWIGLPSCRLEPGSYRITGRWDLIDRAGSLKVQTGRSNVFSVSQ